MWKFNFTRNSSKQGGIFISTNVLTPLLPKFSWNHLKFENYFQVCSGAKVKKKPSQLYVLNEWNRNREFLACWGERIVVWVFEQLLQNGAFQCCQLSPKIIKEFKNFNFAGQIIQLLFFNYFTEHKIDNKYLIYQSWKHWHMQQMLLLLSLTKKFCSQKKAIGLESQDSVK